MGKKWKIGGKINFNKMHDEPEGYEGYGQYYPAQYRLVEGCFEFSASQTAPDRPKGRYVCQPRSPRAVQASFPWASESSAPALPPLRAFNPHAGVGPASTAAAVPPSSAQDGRRSHPDRRRRPLGRGERKPSLCRLTARPSLPGGARIQLGVPPYWQPRADGSNCESSLEAAI